MDNSRSREPQPALRLESQEAAQSFEDVAWQLIGDAETMIAALEIDIETLYLELTGYQNRLLGLQDRKQQAASSAAYEVKTATLLQLRQTIHEIALILERQEENLISEEDAHTALSDYFLEQSAPESPDTGAMSKKKRAIYDAARRIAQERGINENSYEFRDLLEELRTSGPGLTTDPRRIASGRHATRIVAGTLDAFHAEGTYIEATADTHGGKSRRPGKNSTHYVGASGRRIRKK